MDMKELCSRIHLPEEVAETVLAYNQTLNIPEITLLRREERWEEGLKAVEAALGDDPKGFRMLTAMLRCALECKKDYDILGIPEEIYFASMGCFRRFVGEHMVSFGCWGFDRGFWTVRQVSGKLFRIGQLEYELLTEKGRKLISIHIPSDAKLETALLRTSYEDAKTLIGRCFPEFKDAPFVCESWLLSPDLTQLLPETSRILAFQRSFTLVGTRPDDSYAEWVYKRTDIPTMKLPESTHLQRSLKAFLLSGGVFRNGEGILVPDPFRD